MSQTIENFIGGEFVPPTSGSYLEGFDPAIGKGYLKIPDSSAEDVERAVQAAKRAFPAWSILPMEERVRILTKLGDFMERDFEKLSRAESVDSGKPISLARSVDISRAVRNVRFFTSAIQQFSSESYENDQVSLHYTLRRPLGVVACISPWNLPLYLFTWKVAPALAAGNTVVAKPSEITPMTAYLFSKLAAEAGVPPGVLNVIHGTGPKVGSALTQHPDIRAISFTGGTTTGREIARVAAPLLKKLSLELGGKNPNLIFADCKYDEMLADTVRSGFSNQGQVCLAGSRVYVEKSLYDRFKKDFVEKVKGLRVGDPLDEATQQGAVVSKAHHEKILSYLKLAKEEGGKILCGGGPAKISGRCESGWFVEPTVIEGLSPTCRTNQEEIFGPVVTITPFNDDEEALRLANGTAYGLAAMVWTENLTRAHRLARDLEAGMVWINQWMVRDLRVPFGGMKNSGVGREGGVDVLRFFTEPKSVSVKL